MGFLILVSAFGLLSAQLGCAYLTTNSRFALRRMPLLRSQSLRELSDGVLRPGSPLFAEESTVEVEEEGSKSEEKEKGGLQSLYLEEGAAVAGGKEAEKKEVVPFQTQQQQQSTQQQQPQGESKEPEKPLTPAEQVASFFRTVLYVTVPALTLGFTLWLQLNDRTLTPEQMAEYADMTAGMPGAPPPDWEMVKQVREGLAR
uniref:Transmembrane protein n=1 Tax=Chromera velia CCMP2878 TaxID=1169474 RepID=A0A0G4HX04_9ALVE|mmetsp:Transcript_53835/g.105290  ORF Transcript_53835/g.105290 Transcript_53835/m.105290 type:complete len:201 (+) Transcript_53835:125-727(+)|eukprot:Cvel_32966.t1-p1 / transcript=Cvel_32966.t1 / gene=Cvel_32966 / organism=Chromera_velia_CCMP2878 / gene_product=hypothetical protein / transcript_product=hypothetical protein / location=Cvel_scaffold5235:1844-4921(+) / protein_length=200 / sequence_SO=supercontig / SO=protein_coding / is_pseudo=false